jgi:glutamate-1-semialdehyde 2,1-aminomutase
MVAVLANQVSLSNKRSLKLSTEFSKQLAELVPGGVNSAFRSFKEVGGETIFLNRALGSKVYDIDDNCYIDYLGAWGPAVLGHCHPEVIAACQKALALGPVLGTPHQSELDFAAALVEAIPSFEQVRFVSTGTEAVMSAIRLARGVTGKDKIIMFEGSYHGHSDAVLASQSHKASAGIPVSTANNSLLVDFNNLEALESCLKTNRSQIAAVLMEPVAGAMAVVPPIPGYLEGVRQLCNDYDCLLIFDEVITGFRVALAGAQSLYNVMPDLTCFGKALGGGMPIGAYGGSKKLMSNLLPIGEVYQAGTFSGNPVTMAGGIATLKLLSNPKVFQRLEFLSETFFSGLQNVIDTMGIKVQLERVGSMFAIIFAPHPIRNYRESLSIDSRAYAEFFHYLLEHGIYMPPSSVDAAALSAAHSEEEIALTIDIFRDAFKQLTSH